MNNKILKQPKIGESIMSKKSKNQTELQRYEDLGNSSAVPMKSRDILRRKIGWTVIGVAGVSVAMLFAGLFFGQRKQNKELTQENHSLWEKTLNNCKELGEAHSTVSYVSAQRDMYKSELEDCRGNYAPKAPAKPAPQPVVKKVAPQPKKPVAKPQPKPAPAPVVKYEPVIIRDTVRDTLKQEPVIVRDTVVYSAPRPVVMDTVVRPSVPVSNNAGTGAVSFKASFRNKMASDAKCR